MIDRRRMQAPLLDPQRGAPSLDALSWTPGTGRRRWLAMMPARLGAVLDQ